MKVISFSRINQLMIPGWKPPSVLNRLAVGQTQAARYILIFLNRICFKATYREVEGGDAWTGMFIVKDAGLVLSGVAILLLGPGKRRGVGPPNPSIGKRQFAPPSRLSGSDHRRLSSPRAHHRITLHHYHGSLSADGITAISKPSEPTSIIHIAVAVAVAVATGHCWGNCWPRPLSPTAARYEQGPRDSLSAHQSDRPQPNRQQLHLTPEAPPHPRQLPTPPQKPSSVQSHLAKCDRTAPLTPCRNNLGSRPSRSRTRTSTGHQAPAPASGRGASPGSALRSLLKQRTGRHGSQHDSHTSTCHPPPSKDEAPNPCRHPDKWRAVLILSLTFHVGKETTQQRKASPQLCRGKRWHRHCRASTKSHTARDHCSTQWDHPRGHKWRHSAGFDQCGRPSHDTCGREAA